MLYVCLQSRMAYFMCKSDTLGFRFRDHRSVRVSYRVLWSRQRRLSKSIRYQYCYLLYWPFFHVNLGLWFVSRSYSSICSGGDPTAIKSECISMDQMPFPPFNCQHQATFTLKIDFEILFQYKNFEIFLSKVSTFKLKINFRKPTSSTIHLMFVNTGRLTTHSAP